MAKIAFKNPKGNTLYWACLGFDWGAFWGFILFGGLPFFLRKMNMLGIYTLGFSLIAAVKLSGYVHGRPLHEVLPAAWGTALFFLAIAIYFGIKGGKMTARHYLEEGYEIDTKDEAIVSMAKLKWKLKE
ncbi:MAG: hypothetical protein K2P93_01160 [Alphaproteobacteria bacterium]|nr:hypothetical protein [Alphaproteobacteria bacterium]